MSGLVLPSSTEPTSGRRREGRSSARDIASRDRVVRLVRPVQREEHVVVPGFGREDADEPAAVRDTVGGDPEVAASLEDPGRAPLEKRGLEGRVGLAEDEGAAGLDDPGLVAGDVEGGASEVLDVVDADVRDRGDAPGGDVGRVPTAADTDLDDGGVDRDVGEPPVGDPGEDLEVARCLGEMRLDRRDEGQQLVEGLVVDLVLVPGDPLVDPLEVRARVGTDGQSALDEERGGEPGGGRLAVRAREMQDRILELR